MQPTESMSILNVLVAFLGVFIVGFALFEWRRLRRLRQDMELLEERTGKKINDHLRATHRILASYHVQDIDQRIALLESAVNDCPEAFNGQNALGFAYLEKGETQKALDAFTNAVALHPLEKASYFDLAFAHLQAGNTDLAVKYLRKALKVDPTSRADLMADKRFAGIVDQV